PLHIILLGEMVADLHQHRDRFGIAGLVLGRLVSAGAELPTVAVADDGDDYAVRRIGMNLELSPRHFDQLGFCFGGLAHAFPPAGFGGGCPFAWVMSRATRSWTCQRAGPAWSPDAPT